MSPNRRSHQTKWLLLFICCYRGHFAFDKSILISPRPSIARPSSSTSTAAYPFAHTTTQQHNGNGIHNEMKCIEGEGSSLAICLSSPAAHPFHPFIPSSHSQLIHHCKCRISCVLYVFWPFNDFWASSSPRSWQRCISFTHTGSHTHTHTPGQIDSTEANG